MMREVCINFSHLAGGGGFESSGRGRQFSVICQEEAILGGFEFCTRPSQTPTVSSSFNKVVKGRVFWRTNGNILVCWIQMIFLGVPVTNESAKLHQNSPHENSSCFKKYSL